MNLKETLAQAKIEIDKDALIVMESYASLLREWSVRMNLMSKNELERIESHIADSLLGDKRVKRLSPKKVLDIGSGGGFPAIPLSVVNPEVTFLLSERSEKKCRFLKNAVKELALDNVYVTEKPFEQLSEDFDVVTFRAFQGFNPKLIKRLRRTAPGGIVVAYKGRYEKSEEEVATIADMVPGIEIEKLDLSLTEGRERTLIQFKL